MAGVGTIDSRLIISILPNSLRSMETTMEFGVQFFPDVKPEEKSARDYFAESLDIAEEAERLGFTHARIVEHYFHYYGGYHPHPMPFRSAPTPPPNRPRLRPRHVAPPFSTPPDKARALTAPDSISTHPH